MSDIMKRNFEACEIRIALPVLIETQAKLSDLFTNHIGDFADHFKDIIFPYASHQMKFSTMFGMEIFYPPATPEEHILACLELKLLYFHQFSMNLDDFSEMFRFLSNLVPKWILAFYKYQIKPFPYPFIALNLKTNSKLPASFLYNFTAKWEECFPNPLDHFSNKLENQTMIIGNNFLYWNLHSLISINANENWEPNSFRDKFLIDYHLLNIPILEFEFIADICMYGFAHLSLSEFYLNFSEYFNNFIYRKTNSDQNITDKLPGWLLDMCKKFDFIHSDQDELLFTKMLKTPLEVINYTKFSKKKQWTRQIYQFMKTLKKSIPAVLNFHEAYRSDIKDSIGHRYRLNQGYHELIQIFGNFFDLEHRWKQLSQKFNETGAEIFEEFEKKRIKIEESHNWALNNLVALLSGVSILDIALPDEKLKRQLVSYGGGILLLWILLRISWSSILRRKWREIVKKERLTIQDYYSYVELPKI
jgi:hypothetical protein